MFTVLGRRYGHAKRKSKAQLHRSCTVERTMKITHGLLGPGGILKQRHEWVTRPCGTPLFDDKERKTGVCDACRSGWSVPDSQPTAKGLETIAGAS